MFELRNRTTVAVAGGNGTLEIREGTILGDGTVSGNVDLGRAGGPSPSANLCAGWTVPQGKPSMGQPPSPSEFIAGVFNISGNLRMLNSNTGVSTATTAGGAYSKVVVAGSAQLTGEFAFVRHPDYKPGKGTTFTAFTAGSIANGSDFATYYMGNECWVDDLGRSRWTQRKANAVGVVEVDGDD
jgi:hypothetical protein